MDSEFQKEDDCLRQKELKSTDWQRNLKIAWIGTFFTGASFSIVMPFMALYIEELGVKGDMVEWYAGLSVAISALASALVSPVWGRLADRYGRKPMMIRASMVMTFTMGGLALVPNVFWLLFLRTLNGLFAGYVPNATALIASQVPQNRSGYALGTLSTGLTAGVLIGPLLGGTLSEAFGMRGTFLLVGLILFICCLLILQFQCFCIIKSLYRIIDRFRIQSQIFNLIFILIFLQRIVFKVLKKIIRKSIIG